jgi:hypothetical protein
MRGLLSSKGLEPRHVNACFRSLYCTLFQAVARLCLCRELIRPAVMQCRSSWIDLFFCIGIFCCVFPFFLLLVTACAFSAQPGQWVSIGPDHVFGPPVSGFGEYNAVGRITTIAVDPTNPQIIYVGSPGELGQEGCGIWKTADGGLGIRSASRCLRLRLPPSLWTLPITTGSTSPLPIRASSALMTVARTGSTSLSPCTSAPTPPTAITPPS